CVSYYYDGGNYFDYW
nr:immunoglobulin heavy chain junction region [Macaca mulatta]MOX94775.1 immunoglobulin heavy chain junction region [Macaca mulatta]MOX96076.1 immunoglobulin heavy chain junction region [Macaca mulatta]